MMRAEDPTARCFTQGCSTVVNLHDYPEALCDGCGEVTCCGCEHECAAVVA